MASGDAKARGKESPEHPEPPTPKATKHMASESPAQSTTMAAAQHCSEVELPDCRRCKAVAKLELVEKDDDHKYVSEYDDFRGNKNLELQVIHYRRKKFVAGFFYADCPPCYTSCEGIYFVGHPTGIPNLEELVTGALQYAIKEYNTKNGDNLTSDGILYATQECYGCSLALYITFTGKSDKAGPQTYQTMVIHGFSDHPSRQIIIFRRRSNPKDDYVDLLPPPKRRSHREQTRVRKELMYTLDGSISLEDPFYEDYARIREEQGVKILILKSEA